ncbi:hypothetical protein WA158_004312 [Blastocystis sp. Blastoise]
MDFEAPPPVSTYKRRRHVNKSDSSKNNTRFQKKIIRWDKGEMDHWKESMRCSSFLPNTKIFVAKTPLDSIYEDDYESSNTWSVSLLVDKLSIRKSRIETVFDLTNPNMLFYDKQEFEDWDIELKSYYNSGFDGDDDAIIPHEETVQKILNDLYNARARCLCVMTKYGDQVAAYILCRYIIIYMVEKLHYPLEKAIDYPAIPAALPSLPVPLLFSSSLYKQLFNIYYSYTKAYTFQFPQPLPLPSVFTYEDSYISWNPVGRQAFLLIYEGNGYIIISSPSLPIIIDIHTKFPLPPPSPSTPIIGYIHTALLIGTIVQENITPPLTRFLLSDIYTYIPTSSTPLSVPLYTSPLQRRLRYLDMILNTCKKYYLSTVKPESIQIHLRMQQYFESKTIQKIYKEFVPKLTHLNNGLLFKSLQSGINFQNNPEYYFYWIDPIIDNKKDINNSLKVMKTGSMKSFEELLIDMGLAKDNE